MEVNPSVPAKTVPEFIAYAKANPGKINMASAGPGSAPHVAGELFRAMTGLDLVRVHYRGSAPALTDLIAGQVQVMFDPLPSSIPHIRAGKLRPLGATTATRSEVLPEVDRGGDWTYEGKQGHLGRCYLRGRAGDAANVILSAIGYNLRLVLAWLRMILRLLLLLALQMFAIQPAFKPAS
jgi:hypothetical protein